MIEYGKRRLNQNQNSSSISSIKINIKELNEKRSSLFLIEDNSTKTVKSDLKSDQSKLKIQKNQDSESDLTNLVNEENRGLSTDMLGFPAHTKTPTELILSSLPEIEDISHSDEMIEKEFLKVLHSRCFDNRMIAQSLSKILDICKNEELVNKIVIIESLIQELKVTLFILKILQSNKN